MLGLILFNFQSVIFFLFFFFWIWHFLYCIVVEPFLNWGRVCWIVARFGGAEAKQMSGSLRKPASPAAWGPWMIISIINAALPCSGVHCVLLRNQDALLERAASASILWGWLDGMKKGFLLSKPLVFWWLMMTPQESLLGASLVLGSCRQCGVYISVTSPWGIRKNTEALLAK